MTFKTRSICLLLTAVGAWGGGSGYARAQGEPPITIEAIARAWKDRQSRVQSARFVWTAWHTEPKGRQSKIRAMAGGEVPGGAVMPPEDSTYEMPCELCFDGNKLRYHCGGKQWSAERQGWVPDPYTSVFDGKVGKLLHAAGGPKQAFPDGMIRRESYHIDAKVPNVRPVLMTFRGLVPDLRTYDIAGMLLTGRRSVIDGKVCAELQRSLAPGGLVDQLWLDPSRGYVIVRYVSVSRGQVDLQIDVRYRPDPAADWVPSEWDIVSRDDGGALDYSLRARVTDHTINAPVDPAEFDIPFPPGTFVVDEKSNQMFIAKADGQKRVIKRSELTNTSLEQLIHSPGEETLPSVAGFWSVWRVTLVVTTGIGMGCLLLWLWRRARRRPGLT